jgi:hypothetical protein
MADHGAGPLLPELGVHVPHDPGAGLVEGKEVGGTWQCANQVVLKADALRIA